MSHTFRHFLLRRILREATGRKTAWGPDESRRAFLKGAGRATLMAALGGPLASAAAGVRASSRSDSVAIIGAGLAGLTAAYHLKKAGVPFVVYEASARVGGRVFTDRKTFHEQGQFCELGGELVDSGHSSLRQVASELNVALENFPEGDQGVAQELYFYKNQFYSEAQAVAAARPLIRAIRAELKAAFGDKPVSAIDARQSVAPAVRALDDLSLKAWLDRQSELEPWFKEMVAAAYLTECGHQLDEISCLSLFSMFPKVDSPTFSMFGDSDELSRIQGGSESLIQALLKAAGGGAAVKLRHELLALRDRGSRFELTFKTESRTVTQDHGRVLVAIPFTVLRGVEGFATGSRRELELHPIKLKAIREQGYATNSKLMIGFRDRLWRHHDKSPKSNGSMFTDLHCSCLWETSRLQVGPAGIITHYSGGRLGKAASLKQVEVAIADLDRMFPGMKVVHNGKKALMNWAAYPWTKGSYGSPTIGQNTRLLGFNSEPELKDRLHFAGEHTALNSPGFMDGAVESGLRAAKALIEPKGRPSS